MDEIAVKIMSPLLQFGFAGFSVILLAILIWLIWELLKILKDNTKVIAENTRTMKESFTLMVQIKDELYKRPCIAKFHPK